MNFLSLNIRGLGEGGKNKAGWIKNLKRENGIDFIALQEIQFRDISGIEFEKFWGAGKFEMDHVPAAGRSGGVVSMWDPGILKVQDSFKHANFLLTRGTLKGSNQVINIVNVYAPHKVPQKKALWDDIGGGGVMGSHPGWWVILGDFNAVRFKEERRNSIFNSKCASIFNDFIDENGLREYEMKGRKFTYLKDNDNKLSKIDRVLVCQDFFMKWPVACLRAMPRLFSDHCPLILTCSDKNFGPKPFRFFNSWLERKDFDEVVLKEISKFSGVGNPDEALFQKLKKIREALRIWRKEVLTKEGETEMKLKEELECLEEVAEGRELTEEEEWTRMECLKDLKEIEGYKVKDIIQRSRARWDLEGDENTRFFHGYIKSRRACNNIPGLMINDVWVTRPSLIKKEIMGFFKRAFEEKIRERPKLIFQNAKRLSEAEAASLTVPFSKEEIKRAVFECGSDKAPGPDGFNFNFIKRYWNVFENDFL
ncbi:uncharacterized protein LOC110933336 [Helianthus annuus]|uniref:uncharacterized protein LOC110933336 n=1 Tax=Helianthus annuus TaxID=4232 RepID=UPI000B90109B|nr:uncharacterized protein LOC110933336 [Helianthus annuus]